MKQKPVTREAAARRGAGALTARRALDCLCSSRQARQQHVRGGGARRAVLARLPRVLQ